MIKNKGITLVALVITIILLLILAGISIAQLTGSGLFENAKQAEQKSEEAKEKEQGILGDYENTIGEYVDGTRNTSGVIFENLFESSQGASSGTLNNKVEEYDLVVGIFKNPSGGIQSCIIDPKLYKMMGFNFSAHSAYIYGNFEFLENNFTINIASSTAADWNSRYVMYKVVGIKY